MVGKPVKWFCRPPNPKGKLQAVAPFETRRDLALGANVDCDALRARIRAVFSAGMDLDVVVKVHRERGRRRDDCVVAIVQELDDKK